jgi:hypothetical protein
MPAYIYIPKVDFSTNYATQGTQSNKITDVWVFANDALVGAFELPAMVPVIASGNTRIVISAGVMINGVSNTRAINSLMNNYQATIDLQPSKIDTIQPSLTYATSTNFLWLEDFDNVGISLIRSATSANPVSRTPYKAFEGANCMAAITTLDNRIWQAETADDFAVKISGPTFLELNYRTTTTLNIGAMVINGGIPQTIPYLSLRSTIDTATQQSVWKKVYVNLSSVVKSQGANARFKVIFSNIHNATDPQTDSIFIDNLKLMN